MFAESADLYDLIYSTFKDYRAESATLADLIRRANPTARTILDVACGTGEHARLLRERHGFEVDGIDLDPAFIEIARRKNPIGRFTVADMTSFDLGRRYDAVICLFSSIGYLRTIDQVARAIARFRAHVAPLGIIVVEPWLTPDVIKAGHVSTNVAEAPGVHVVRRARTEVAGHTSRFVFDYDITRDGATRHVSEVHELGLYTVDEMRGTFERNGLMVEHDPKGLIGRGLYVARAP